MRLRLRLRLRVRKDGEIADWLERELMDEKG